MEGDALGATGGYSDYSMDFQGRCTASAGELPRQVLVEFDQGPVGHHQVLEPLQLGRKFKLALLASSAMP